MVEIILKGSGLLRTAAHDPRYALRVFYCPLFAIAWSISLSSAARCSAELMAPTMGSPYDVAVLVDKAVAARVEVAPTEAAPVAAVAPAVARTTAITSAPEKRARLRARAMSTLPLRQPLQHSPRQAPASSPTAPAARRSKKTPPMRSIRISLASS